MIPISSLNLAQKHTSSTFWFLWSFQQKGCELGFESQEPNLEPPVLTLQT